MSEVSPHTQVDVEVLTRLAQMDLAWAERAHALAMAEPDPVKAERLSRGYHRAARSARQTIWLKQRILQGRVAPLTGASAPRPAAAPSASPAAPPQPSQAVADHAADRLRGAELGEALGRVIVAYTERERLTLEQERFQPFDETAYDHLWDGLEDQINKREGRPRKPLDAEVAEACAELKLPADLAAAWRALPQLITPEEMVAAADAEEAAFESSA